MSANLGALTQYQSYNPSLGVAQQDWGLLHGKRQEDYVDPLGQSYKALQDYMTLAGNKGQEMAPGYDPETSFSKMLHPLYNQNFSSKYGVSTTPWGGPTEDIKKAYQTLSPYGTPNVDPLSQYESEYNKWLGERTSPVLAEQLKGLGLDLSGAPGVKSATQTQNMLNAQLKQLGVQDLQDVSFAEDGTMYNRHTGQALPNLIHNFRGGEGDGSLEVFLERQKDGNLGFRTDYDKPQGKFVDYLGPIIGSVILGGFGGAIGGALAGSGAGAGATAGAAAGTTTGASTGAGLGTVAGHAVGQGIAGATGAALHGGNVGQGFLGGALAGGIGAGIGTGAGQFNPAEFSGLSNMSPAMQAAYNAAIRGALSGGAKAGVGGGDVANAALTGGLGGGLGSATSSALADYLPQNLSNLAGGALGKYLAQQLVPRNTSSTIPAPQASASQQPITQPPAADQAPNLAGLPDYVVQRIRRAQGIA